MYFESRINNRLHFGLLYPKTPYFSWRRDSQLKCFPICLIIKSTYKSPYRVQIIVRTNGQNKPWREIRENPLRDSIFKNYPNGTSQWLRNQFRRSKIQTLQLSKSDQDITSGTVKWNFLNKIWTTYPILSVICLTWPFKCQLFVQVNWTPGCLTKISSLQCQCTATERNIRLACSLPAV